LKEVAYLHSFRAKHFLSRFITNQSLPNGVCTSVGSASRRDGVAVAGGNAVSAISGFDQVAKVVVAIVPPATGAGNTSSAASGSHGSNVSNKK
jgi:hypothetical protein